MKKNLTAVFACLLWASCSYGQITLSNAQASFAQSSFPASETIDGNYAQGNGWAIDPQESSAQHIMWDVANSSPGLYSFSVAFNFGTYHVLRDYSISWSNDNGNSWNAITSFDSLSTESGASLSSDSEGLLTSGLAITDTHYLSASLGSITGLRIDTPPYPSHRDGVNVSGSYNNYNFVLTEFDVSVTAVPEPATFSAFIGMLALLGVVYARKRS